MILSEVAKAYAPHEIRISVRNQVFKAAQHILNDDPGAASPISITLGQESCPDPTKLLCGIDIDIDTGSALDDVADDATVKARLEKVAAKQKAKLHNEALASLLNLAKKLASDNSFKFLGVSHDKDDSKIIEPAKLAVANIWSDIDPTFLVFDVMSK